MSKSKSSKKTSHSKAHAAPAEPPAEGKHDGRNRWVLIGLAIFCLLIFTVTGPMTAVFASWFGGGPANVAKLVLPSGADEISFQDYDQARNYLSWERRILGGSRDMDDEQIIAYATKRKLADELEILVSDQELRDYLSLLVQISRRDYESLWRGTGLNSALGFESLMRELLRVRKVEELLLSASVPTDEEVLEEWRKDYQEMRVEYLVFDAEEFEEAAAAEEPEEEALQEFYDSGLNFSQRNELENEERVAFEALVVSAEALETEAVQAWAPQEEPTEEGLDGFYNFRRFSLYRRPEPEDGEEPDLELGPTLTKEELGDRLTRDFRLSQAALALLNEAGDAEDLAAFAAEKGVELVVEAEPVAASQLPELPRIGAPELRQVVRSELDQFLGQALLADGIAYIVRPTEQIERSMPPLEEVRESVVDYWREKRRYELALEAAEAFVDDVPLPEGAVEGDAKTLDSEEFASRAAAAAEGQIQVLDWISRRVRPTVDPKWGTEERLPPWLRTQVGNQLPDTVDGELLGPLEYAAGSQVIVARVDGRREPDASKIWPGELNAARQRMRSVAQNRFREEQLSYEGLARAYQIEKNLLPEPEEDV